jgi:hypothetical protein
MNDEQNKRIEDILRSLDGLQKAEANPFMATRIRNRLQQPPVMSRAWSWRLALVMMVIVLLNMLTIRQFYFSGTKESGAESIAREYAISINDTYASW